MKRKHFKAAREIKYVVDREPTVNCFTGNNVGKNSVATSLKY